MLMNVIALVLFTNVYGMERPSLTGRVFVSQETPRLKDKISVAALLDKVTLNNENGCARRCSHTADCKSFFYNKHTEACQLHGEQLNATTDSLYSESPGYRYYNMKQQDIDDCAATPCQNGGGCKELDNGYQCTCAAGFKGRQCEINIDDCAANQCKNGGTCKDKVNDYSCTCPVGFDGKNCDIGPTPFLLFSDKTNITRLNPKTLEERTLYRSAQDAKAIDYDISKRLIYWSDVSDDMIYRAQVTDDTFSALDGEPHAVHERIKSYGLAVDWIHDNIYWSDYNEGVISVSTTAGGLKKTLVTNLTSPKAVAVDPRKGWVYWSDTVNQKIERCGMNGANRQILIEENILWSLGLTLDFSTDRLYWGDVRLRTIASSQFDGQDRRNILNDSNEIGYPYGITVSEDILYWTDYFGGSIKYINKFTGEKVGEHYELLSKLSRPAGIQAVHPYRQPLAKNVCGNNNQNCSHLCLPAPQKDDSDELMEAHSLPYSCACPDNYNFNKDGKTCSQSVVSTTQTDASTTEKPKSDGERC